MEEDCIFCRIVSGEIPCQRVYEDDLVLAFEDIHPLAPIHVLVIPKLHISTVLDISAENADKVIAMISAVQKIAELKGIAQRGFRMVMNCNPDGGQVIYHLHLHLLGGKKLRDDPQ